jgi:3',5'-cyclic AMP phosphodiesterase CpdA
VVLISDLHVAGPDMPPARVARIVQQINGLSPDIVLIAGDLVSDKRLATRALSGGESAAAACSATAASRHFRRLG